MPHLRVDPEVVFQEGLVTFQSLLFYWSGITFVFRRQHCLGALLYRVCLSVCLATCSLSIDTKPHVVFSSIHVVFPSIHVVFPSILNTGSNKVNLTLQNNTLRIRNASGSVLVLGVEDCRYNVCKILGC